MADDPAAPDRYRLHADICKVLTDPKRLLLLAALRDGDRTVGDLAASIGASLPNASQHLAILRAAGLVEGRRDGAAVRYRIAEPAILDACDIVDGIVERRLARRAPARPTSESAASRSPAASPSPAASTSSASPSPALRAG